MKPIAIALLTAVAPRCTAQDRFTRELDDAARVASVMVDGDACRRIVTAARDGLPAAHRCRGPVPGERQLRSEPRAPSTR